MINIYAILQHFLCDITIVSQWRKVAPFAWKDCPLCQKGGNPRSKLPLLRKPLKITICHKVCFFCLRSFIKFELCKKLFKVCVQLPILVLRTCCCGLVEKSWGTAPEPRCNLALTFLSRSRSFLEMCRLDTPPSGKKCIGTLKPITNFSVLADHSWHSETRNGLWTEPYFVQALLPSSNDDDAKEILQVSMKKTPHILWWHDNNYYQGCCKENDPTHHPHKWA